MDKKELRFQIDKIQNVIDSNKADLKARRKKMWKFIGLYSFMAVAIAAIFAGVAFIPVYFGMSAWIATSIMSGLGTVFGIVSAILCYKEHISEDAPECKRKNMKQLKREIKQDKNSKKDLIKQYLNALKVQEEVKPQNNINSQNQQTNVVQQTTDDVKKYSTKKEMSAENNVKRNFASREVIDAIIENLCIEDNKKDDEIQK